jgi:RNA polymerase sigma-70 factor (ECF subfamily)
MNLSSLPSTESSLLRRVQANDAVAWCQFVDLYGPWLYQWGRRFGLSPADAADVTQESFASICRAIGKFDHTQQRATLRGWMWTIVHNKARDLLTERSGQVGAIGGSQIQQLLQAIPEQLPHEQSDTVEAGAVGAVFHRALAQVQAEFEPQTWQAFWQVGVEGRTSAEVAADLNLSTNSVRQARSRVSRRLREYLGDDFPELLQ